mgnify:CR=1 FL=1
MLIARHFVTLARARSCDRKNDVGTGAHGRHGSRHPSLERPTYCLQVRPIDTGFCNFSRYARSC